MQEERGKATQGRAFSIRRARVPRRRASLNLSFTQCELSKEVAGEEGYLPPPCEGEWTRVCAWVSFTGKLAVFKCGPSFEHFWTFKLSSAFHMTKCLLRTDFHRKDPRVKIHSEVSLWVKLADAAKCENIVPGMGNFSRKSHILKYH